MAENTECCGWASWGELAGVGDGSVSAESWEERKEVPPDTKLRSASSDDSSDSSHASRPAPAITGDRRSGRRARAQLAVSRWRLGERNKHG